MMQHRYVVQRYQNPPVEEVVTRKCLNYSSCWKKTQKNNHFIKQLVINVVLTFPLIVILLVVLYMLTEKGQVVLAFLFSLLLHKNNLQLFWWCFFVFVFFLLACGVCCSWATWSCDGRIRLIDNNNENNMQQWYQLMVRHQITCDTEEQRQDIALDQ